ncbi:MAG: hypothetical protein ACLR1V_08565 [Coprococcus sp.]
MKNRLRVGMEPQDWMQARVRTGNPDAAAGRCIASQAVRAKAMLMCRMRMAHGVASAGQVTQGQRLLSGCQGRNE